MEVHTFCLFLVWIMFLFLVCVCGYLGVWRVFACGCFFLGGFACGFFVWCVLMLCKLFVCVQVCACLLCEHRL